MRIAIPPLSPGLFAASPPDAAIGRASGDTMGTVWSAQVAGLDAAGISALVTPVLARAVAQMSHWDPQSSLSRFNRLPCGQWQALEPDFAAVIAAALDLARLSDGAFDPAAGALVNLWGFGPPGPRDTLPGPDEIAAALASSGHDALAWDPAARRLMRRRPVLLDLSGIAKGHAVDMVADALIAAGHRHFLVEIGGELRGAGLRPDGQPWWVDVEAPDAGRTPLLRIAAVDMAVATSGDYVRRLTLAGRIYAHSLDPRSGAPITHGTASVTVIAPRCMTADGWATALTVLPPDRAVALADEHGIAALGLSRDGREWQSRALGEMLG
ncbi:FAD:protein FMN transferase [Sphingomonas changnyeongensis]|uniref:FAD:protein FMN transferase n=1 Tax=Sphingomonas changnyeongensis TaxID=2698679 RepID=A0A7Z2NXF0_9SPHN|nr:FAD:protein FMN transferase [Sphingomonas changnyeongensis]QHL91580.1 FAD:protein FMN transferase [Sphingomonas changnyeongensis]